MFLNLDIIFIRLLDILKLNKINLINFFIEKYSIFFFGSNHYNRFDYIKKIRKKKIKLQKCKKKFIYLGDSHVEYFSRNLFFKKKQIFSIAKWLGPITILGILKMDNLQKLISQIKRYSSTQNIVLISIGSIDIRTSVYELFLRKSLKSNQELKKLFEQTLEHLFINIKKSINNNHGIGFYEIFCDSEKSFSPNTIKKITYYRENFTYPIFGPLKKRKYWCKIVNKIIYSKCIKYKFKFRGPGEMPKPRNLFNQFFNNHFN